MAEKKEKDSRIHETLDKVSKTKCLDAISKYLDKRGWPILEREYQCEFGSVDFVANDNNDVVFINVVAEYKDNNEPIENNISISDFEGIAISWLKDNPDINDVPIRFDTISMKVFSSNRALIRHAINALKIK